MTNEDKVNYYRKACINMMNHYETIAGKLMSDQIDTGDLEKAIWNANDEKDYRRLASIYNRLAKLIDSLEMD